MCWPKEAISNFFGNLQRPLIIVNDLLQGKGRDAPGDTGRLVLNSTVGIGGLFDVATLAGLEQHDEDSGQTLAKWGVPDGPYVQNRAFLIHDGNPPNGDDDLFDELLMEEQEQRWCRCRPQLRGVL